MDVPKILFTGDGSANEFQSILETLNKNCISTQVPLNRIEEADEALHSADLIVILQSRRGQFQQSQVDAIRDLAPLKPIVNLLGSRCEGDLRDGTALKGVVRLFWYQWPTRLALFWRQRTRFGMSSWHLPPTATDTDRWEWEQTGYAMFSDGSSDRGSRLDSTEMADRPIHLAVIARDRTGFESIVEIARSRGWKATFLTGHLNEQVDLVCIDGDSLDSWMLGRLAWIGQVLPGIPRIVLLNFPRIHDVEILRRAGIPWFLGKPFRNEEFHLVAQRALDNPDETCFIGGIAQPRNLATA